VIAEAELAERRERPAQGALRDAPVPLPRKSEARERLLSLTSRTTGSNTANIRGSTPTMNRIEALAARVASQ
jgi:hypothetical protein